MKKFNIQIKKEYIGGQFSIVETRTIEERDGKFFSIYTEVESVTQISDDEDAPIFERYRFQELFSSDIEEELTAEYVNSGVRVK